jgi:Helicase HerA, central domain
MSGGGKSTVAAGLLERFSERGFQFCVIDPEGDYAELDSAVALGDAKHEPRLQEAVELLRHPKENLVVNLLGVQLDERPRYFAKLFPQLCQLRAETARPHWMLIDEAHHMMPPEWATAATLPQQLQGTVLVTVHPEHVARSVLETIALVVAVGPDPRRRCALFAAPWARTRRKCATDRPSGASPISGSGGNAGSAVCASMNRASIFDVTRANTRKASWARTAASTSAGQMAA